jgi:hypothetical protein
MLLYSGCLLVLACLTIVSYTSTFSFHEFGGGRSRTCLGFSYGPRLLVKHVQRGLRVTVYMQINHAKIISLLGGSGQ